MKECLKQKTFDDLIYERRRVRKITHPILNKWVYHTAGHGPSANVYKLFKNGMDYIQAIDERLKELEDESK